MKKFKVDRIAICQCTYNGIEIIAKSEEEVRKMLKNKEDDFWDEPAICEMIKSEIDIEELVYSHLSELN
jgi:hypothetical protein